MRQFLGTPVAAPGGASTVLANRLAAALPPGTFFSPVSLELALALVAAGAAGTTLRELQGALAWPTAPASWQQELAARFAGLYAATAAAEPVLAVANRVYAKVPIKVNYVKAVQAVGAPASDVSFWRGSPSDPTDPRDAPRTGS